MADEDLLADTNRLLRQLVENEATKRQPSEGAGGLLDGMRERLAAKDEERRQERLVKEGIPRDATDEEVEKRRKEAFRRSEENIKISREREDQYRADLLHELRSQSDLLRRITEKLDR